MCFAIQSETQLGCHYQRGRLHLCGPSLLAFPLDHHQHGRSCASQHGRLRHLLFPRSGSKGMGRGSLPKAQLAAHITGHLCALLTLAPLPQVPACFPRALLHLPQILLLQPGAAPRLPSSQHHSCSLGTAHSHTEQLGGGGDVARHAPDI